jgi:hypothetical protein
MKDAEKNKDLIDDMPGDFNLKSDIKFQEN